MENLPTDTSCRNAAIARWDDEGGATLTESGRQSRSIPQPGYRIVTKAVVRYGVEVSEPNKPPRVCSPVQQRLPQTWIAELKRLWAAKKRFDQIASNA
jgi:hypothetical protein